MSNDSIQDGRKYSGVGAATGGAGIGIFLVSWANGLPEDNSYRTLLYYLVPFASSIGGLLWLWGLTKITAWVQNKGLGSTQARALKTLERALNDPGASEEHKATMRKKYEGVSEQVMDAHLEQAKNIGSEFVPSRGDVDELPDS
jgi:hypothetical protein